MSRRSGLAGGGGSSSLSPTLIYSLDLTAQGNVGSISLGAFNVDGKEWQFVNGGLAEAPTLSLTTAAGLKLSAGPAGASYGWALLPLGEVGATVLNALWRRPVVVTARAEITTPAGGVTTVGQVYAQDGTDAAGKNNWSQCGNKLKNDGWYPTMVRTTTQYPAGINTIADNITDDVVALTLFDSGSFAMATGAWSSGYPQPGAMREHGAMSLANLGQPGVALPTVGDLSVGVAVYQDGAAATEVKLKGLKIEVY